MPVRRLGVVAVVIVCLGGFAIAQDEDLPLSNWGAPPYWTPPLAQPAEGEAGGRMPARAQGMTAQAESLPSSPLPFVAIAPCRIVDTRVNIIDGFHRPNFDDDEARTFNFPVSADCPGLPSTAGAYSLNIQFRPLAQLAYLTAYPTGTTMPLVSTVVGNPAGWTTNAAVVPAGTSGQIDVYCQFAGRVVIDINGYYGPQSVVTSLNTKTGDVTLAAGSNVTITPSGNTLTIAATGGPGGVLPAGTEGQTLYHNGSAWTASSALTNNGTNVFVSGLLVLPETTSAGHSGVLYLGYDPFLHNYGPANAGNTFVGLLAGNFTMGGATPEGMSNTAIGFVSMRDNTTGYHNTSSGSYSLRKNTTGHDNTASGYVSLGLNTTGSDNTASGSYSLYDNTGSTNTAVGSFSGTYNSTGSGNVFLGNRAGAFETGSNRLYIANSLDSTLIYGQFDTAKVGIATNGPEDTLSVQGGVRVDQGGAFDGSTFHSGAAALKFGAGDTGEGIASARSGSTNVDGLDFYTGYTRRMAITNGGYVGIATAVPSVALDVNGSIRSRTLLNLAYSEPVCANSNGILAGCAPSDARLKANVVGLTEEKDVLALLAGLRAVAFDWDATNPRVANAGQGRQIGFIAQEVEAVLPEVVHLGADGYRSMDYAKLTTILVEVAKAQQARLDTQQAQIEDRDARIAALEARLATIEARMAGK